MIPDTSPENFHTFEASEAYFTANNEAAKFSELKLFKM